MVMVDPNPLPRSPGAIATYYSGLLMTRAGLQTLDEYLMALSSLIGSLQSSPGRLLQSVERSSLERHPDQTAQQRKRLARWLEKRD